MRKLVACLACRNNSTRLYGKPVQNLDTKKKITILEYIINLLKKISAIDEIVLAISHGEDNIIFKSIAEKNKIEYIFGSAEDVLKRLIISCEKVEGTDIFRMTTESPFVMFEYIEDAWAEHSQKNSDITVIDNVPDGSGFEIINLNAYKKSWKRGNKTHRSEFCSLYIRENKDDFEINYYPVAKEYLRKDIRLTVDNPEDLILARDIYKKFKNDAPLIPVLKIIKYLDDNPIKKKIVEKFVPEGLKTMYL